MAEPQPGGSVDLALGGDYTPAAGGAIALDIAYPKYLVPAGDAVALDLWDNYIEHGPGDQVTLDFRPFDAPRPLRFPQLGGEVSLDFSGDYTPPVGDAVTLDIAREYGDGGDGEPEPEPDPYPPFRGPMLQVGMPWGEVTQSLYRESGLPWPGVTPRPREQALPWAENRALAAQRGLPWGDIPRRRVQYRLPWDDALDYRPLEIGAPWRETLKRRPATALPWADSLHRRSPSSSLAYAHPPKRHREVRARWRRLMEPLPVRISLVYDHPPQRHREVRAPWGDKMRPPPYLIRPETEPPEPPPDTIEPIPAGDAVGLDLHCRRPDWPAGYAALDFGSDCPPPYVESGQVGSTLVVSHTYSVTRVDTGEAVDVASLRLAAEIDSWTWELSAELLGEEAATRVRPGSTGPRELDVTIDGITWRVLAEQYRQSRSVEDRGLRRSRSLQGRGHAAWLAAPYAPAQSYTEGSDRTAQQLAIQELNNTGWTLDWQTVDWLVPAGAYSYSERTPIQAVNAIAEAVGAVVIADTLQQTLTVKPRYPASPWDWSTTTPEATLDADQIISLGSDVDQLPEGNRVFVAGQAPGGVLVETTRQGTAGDRVLPQVVDGLITHVDAGRERGRVQLSATGPGERVSVSVPLVQPPAGPGLLLPGQLVELQEETGNAWRGLVTAANVDARGAAVHMQLEIERRTAHE